MTAIHEASVYVTAVRIEYAGAQLEGDHASGVSSLVVDDAFEFNEGAGELLLGGDTLEYVGWDDDTNTIQLAAPTTSAYGDGDAIRLLPLTPIKVADVVDIEGPSLPAIVWHTLDPFLREGIYAPNEQPTGTIFYTGDYEKVWLVNVPGKVTALDPGTIDYPTTTNRCTDPEPANRDNWVGGDVADGGGVWAFGYAVTNDSTYAAQGLHVKIDHGSGGGAGKISPNGDGFGVDPFDPGGYGNALGTDVKTYKITEDMVFAFSLFSTADCQIEMGLYLYEADGTEISHTVSSALYMTNPLVVVPASTHYRYSTHVYFNKLLEDFPTVDSVAFMPSLGGGVADVSTWTGSCMAVNAGGLAPGVTVPYAPAGETVVYPNPPVVWDEIAGRPTTFPPSAHTHVVADVTDLDPNSLIPTGGTSGQVLTKDTGTDFDVSWQTAASGSGGIQVNAYTTAQNATAWTKPVGAKEVTIEVVAGGAGGGSGRRGASLSARGGGPGGGAGGGSVETFEATTLPASLYVWVGAGGVGGAAVTTDNTAGNAGTSGAASFVTLSSSATQLVAKEDAIISAAQGAAPAGGGTATVVGGVGGIGTKFTGGSGGSGVVASASAQAGVNGGGAGAAGISTADAIQDNSLGTSKSRGAAIVGTVDVVASNVSGVTAPAGSTSRFASLSPRPGSGGGSSRSASAVAAGAGGAGGKGAGGGGGGASLNGFASGAGGNGGDGYVLITTYF